MNDKSKTTTTLSFRCPHDMLEAIDSIGREHYPTEKNSKTNSGCDRSKTLFHIIQAGIAALTDGDIQIEVRPSKTESKTAIEQGELEELVKKLIGENLPVIRLTDDNSYVKRCELNQKIDDRIVKALGEDGLFFDSAANDLTTEAISKFFSQSVDNLNGSRDEFNAKFTELQKQVEELKSVPAPPVPQSRIIEELTIDNEELTNDQIPETTSPAVVLNHQSPEDRRYSKIVDWVCAHLNFSRLISDNFGSVDPITNQPCGELFDNEYLIKHNFHGQIAARKDELELKLGIKLVGSKARVTSDVKAILAALGFQVGKKQIKRKETYWVVNPQNEKKL